LHNIDIKVMAFLRMDNPLRKEFAACVKETALVSSKKYDRKPTSNFMDVLHERPVGWTLMDVLPSLSRNQVQTLLREIKRDNLVYCLGRTNAGRWYPRKR